MKIINIEDNQFEDKVINSQEIILCDFWAEWCGPCKQISPVLEELAVDLEDKLQVVKINIDQNPEIPSKYGIMSIPTLLLFKRGKVIGTQIGLQSKDELKNWINEKIN